MTCSTPPCRKKNGETVSDPRVFVFPADTYVSGQKINRGTLLITTVNEDKDKGTYECFTVNEFDVDGVKKNLLLSSYEVSTSLPCYLIFIKYAGKTVDLNMLEAQVGCHRMLIRSVSTIYCISRRSYLHVQSSVFLRPTLCVKFFKCTI